MATQYDSIGTRYASFKQLPLGGLETASIKARLGDVTELNCLDLACGLGDWTRRLAGMGAHTVTGVDISQSMIDGAQQVSLSEYKDQMESRIRYIQGDASKPELLDLKTKAPTWPFDLVMGNWFLNYASDYRTLVDMFRTIHDNLHEGGKFIGATPNTHCPMFEPVDDGYGIYVEPMEEVDGTGNGESWAKGWKCRLTANVGEEGITFEMFHFMHQFYERAAAEAGLVKLRWHPVTLPKDGEPKEFYERNLLRPHMCVLTARKPGEHHAWTTQEG